MKYPTGFRSVTASESFDVYYAIPSVVVLYGNGRSFVADQHTHAGRLLRKLDALGKSGVRIRGMICHEGALDLSSIRALNCYLRHGGGLRAFNWCRHGNGSRSWMNKYDWYDLCAHLNLRWSR
jgi:hypothetical protein